MVDTRNKRASVIGVAAAIALTLPAPDGTIVQADRQHAAFCYAGILATELDITDAVADVVIQVRQEATVIQVRPEPSTVNI